MRSLVLLAAAVAWARAPRALPDHGVPPRVLQQLRNGRASRALKWVEQQRAAGSTDPTLTTVEAMVHSARNDDATAVELFSESDGTDVYEAWGVRFHADALRDLGEGQQAAELRNARLKRQAYQGVQSRTDNISRLSDLRASGHYEEAWELSDEAIGVSPTDGAIYAARAMIALGMGDIERADFELLLARERASHGGAKLQIALADAEIELALGQPERALDILEPMQRKAILLEPYAAALGRAYAATGNHAEARIALRDRQYLDQPSPETLAARVELHLAMGQDSVARELADALLEERPGHAAAQRAFALAHGITD